MSSSDQLSPPRRILDAVVIPVVIFLLSRALVMGTFAMVAALAHHDMGQYLTQWDAKWYLSIARDGYVQHIPVGQGTPAQSNLAFFPLLPLGIRAVHVLTHWGFAVSGEVLVTVAGALSSIVVWHMVRDHYNHTVATRAVWLTYFSPAAVVLSMVYSESIIILMGATALWALSRHRWILAGLAAALTSACDPVAVAIVVPCVVAAWLAWRRDRDARAWWAAILSPGGVVVFFGYLWIHTGSPFTWLNAQHRGWQYGPALTGIPYAFYRVARHGIFDVTSCAKVLATVVVGYFILRGFRGLRFPRHWSAYVTTVLCMGVISPIVAVSPRLLLRGFPFFAEVAVVSAKRYFVLVVMVSGGLLVLLTVAAATLRWIP